MKINGVTQSLQQAVSRYSQDDTKVSSSVSIEDALTSSTKGASDIGAVANRPNVREVLSRYDIHSISPTDFSAMIHELSETGEIPESDLKQLANLRQNLEVDGLPADEPIDLLSYLQQRLEKITRSPLGQADPDLSLAQNQFDWIEKFSALQEFGGIDTLDLIG